MSVTEGEATTRSMSFLLVQPPMVTCQLVEYFKVAEETGKRQGIEAGDVTTLDHGIELVTLVVNAKDIDNQTEDIFLQADATIVPKMIYPLGLFSSSETSVISLLVI